MFLFVLHTYSEDGHHKKRVPLLGLPPGPLEPRGRGTADEVPHVVQKHAEHGREVQRGPPGARLRFDCRGKEMCDKGAESHISLLAPAKSVPQVVRIWQQGQIEVVSESRNKIGKPGAHPSVETSACKAMLANQNVVQILSTLLTQRGNCRENGERGRVVDVSDQEVSPTLPEDGLIANPVDFFDALVDRRNLARTALLSLGVVPEKSEKDANNVAVEAHEKP